MNFRSRWKRCVAAVMLAGMTVSGLTAYAEEAQPARNAVTSLKTLKIYQNDGGDSEVSFKSISVTATPRIYDYTKGDASCDIETGSFIPNDNTYYGSATFYDYYGDYERAGNKLSTLYDKSPNDGVAELRTYGAYAGDNDFKDQSAKQWNTAISDYFSTSTIAVDPLYFGGARYFSNGVGGQLKDSLPLYKFSGKRTFGNGYSGVTDRTIRNNSGDKNDAYFPNQGIAANTLGENGQLLLKIDGGTTPAPYFNKDFVRNDSNTYGQGPNGQVYENVTFPFTWDKTTSTWLFDSTKDGAQLKQDEKSGGYFIDRSGQPVNYASANYFFPFNTAGQTVASNEAYKLNYMFGMQLELPFNLTADRMSTVVKADGTTEKADTVFRFAGDDDIWVYIDGKLVLDMGGSHGTVAGAIDFTTGNYMVSGKWDGQSNAAAAMSNTAFWEEAKNGIRNEYRDKNAQYCTTGNLSELFGENGLTTGVRHTIQIFYMERGWDQSNLKMSFNFSQSSMVDISKTVDTTHVSSDLFQDVLNELQAQLDAETYTFQVSAQKNEENAQLQPAANSPYTLVEQNNAKRYLDGTGTMQLQAGQIARFTNEFPYDSYLQISETSKANDTRFTPHWTLKEVNADGTPQPVTKKQAVIDPKDNTPLENMPGNTPYDERVVDGVIPRENGTQSLLLRPFNTGSEKVRLRIDYVNELRTGSLTLRKQLANGQAPTEGSFTLRVKFDNVGGTNVTKTVDVTLDKANGYTKTLDGIPYGTTYSVYEVKQDGWALKEIQPSAAKGAQQEGVYDLYYTGALATDTDSGKTIIFRNSPVNQSTPTPKSDQPAGPTATPQPGNDNPATPMATVTPTATPSVANGKTPGSTPVPTAQVTSAIPQTEDTSHPLLLCILCIAGAFGFGVLYAKLTLWRKQ